MTNPYELVMCEFCKQYVFSKDITFTLLNKGPDGYEETTGETISIYTIMRDMCTNCYEGKRFIRVEEAGCDRMPDKHGRA